MALRLGFRAIPALWQHSLAYLAKAAESLTLPGPPHAHRTKIGPKFTGAL